MSDPSQPEPGQRRGRRRQKVSRRWLEGAIGALALGLVVVGVTVARPTVETIFQASDGSSSSAAVGESRTAAAPVPPSSITLPVPERKPAEPGPEGITQLRKELHRATAKAERSARLLALPIPVKVAYFNMLGCYHTDRDEPHYGFLAYHFGSCQQRMPQEWGYLRDNGISIAGVGEFQGKAWRVLAGIQSGDWSVFPFGQSGPYGQNPVVWRTAEWRLVEADEIRHSLYNCANGGTCKASSTLVRLEHRQSKRHVYVLNTHHTSDGGGGGRRAAQRSLELDRIGALKSSGVPIIYMGDFNDVGPSQGQIGRYLTAAFSGMGIDQIWGSDKVTWASGGYDRSFGRWTDHGLIAVATAMIPGTQPQAD